MSIDDCNVTPTGNIVTEYLFEYGHSTRELYDDTKFDDEYLDEFFAGEVACSPELVARLTELMPDIPRKYWVAYDRVYMFQKQISSR